MSRYLLSLGKRLLRRLPGAVLAAAVFFGACAGVLAAAERSVQAGLEKFNIALCGSTNDPLVGLAVSALQELDGTRFSVSLSTMTEEAARQALLEKRLDAYVVIPEGFVESALRGNVPSVRYVSPAGSTGAAALFQQEVTAVITELLLSAQKGVYGIAGALQDNAQPQLAYPLMNELALEYVALALERDGLYRLQVLGVGSGLALTDYLICGLAVTLGALLCLGFAPMVIQREVTLNRMLRAKGVRPVLQGLGEFAALLLGVAVLAGLVFSLLQGLGVALPFAFWQYLPVLAAMAAFSFCLFSLVREPVSGVLLHFLATAAACLASGCLYPLPFFPEAVQRLAGVLPMTYCREFLAACALDTAASKQALAVFGFTAALLAAGNWLRTRRIGRAEG